MDTIPAEIRQKILYHALVHNKNGRDKLSLEDVQNLRLVNRDWYDTVSVVLRDLNAPMYRLHLARKNSPENPASQLKEFVHRLNMSRNNGCEPTFTLRLEPNFFQDKNHTSFLNLLTLYGSGLLLLDIKFPMNGTMHYNFPNVSLSNLLRFRVACDTNWLITDSQLPKEAEDINAHQCVHLVQAIFQAAGESLKWFSIKYLSPMTDLPLRIESVMPPPSVVSLKYGRIQNATNLCKLLTKGNFPKLHKLQLHPANFTADNLFELLDKFRDTLKTFNLVGKLPYGTQDNTAFSIFVRFPVMSKLEKLAIRSNMVELEHEEEIIATKFPKLTALELTDHHRLTSLQWMMNGTKYQAVKEVALRLLNTKGFPHGSIDAGMIEMVHQAFPNITHFTLRIHGHQVHELRSIFVQMPDLEHMVLEVVKSGQCRCSMTANEWESALIGDKSFGHISIRLLAKLKSLTLCETITPPFPTGPFDYSPSISDKTFELVLFKMPNLVNLALSETFWPSKEIAERWRKEKGVIKYKKGWSGGRCYY